MSDSEPRFVDPTGGAPGSEIGRLRLMLGTRSRAAVPPIAKIREDFEKFSRVLRPPANVVVQPASLGGVPVEQLSPPKAKAGQILYLHGGGYVSGSLSTHRDLAARLAIASQRRVTNVAYRLAPEHPFPAALEDAKAAYSALRTSTPDPIALAGDSAGGALACSLLVSLRDAGWVGPKPTAAALFSPWADLSNSGASVVTHRDPMISKEGIEAMATLYLGGESPQHPLASPLFANLEALPPMLVQAAAEELLLDDSKRLVVNLRRAGNTVEFEIWTGMVHVWHYFAHFLPEGGRAIEQAGAFLARSLS